jgi:hypothetical protein
LTPESRDKLLPASEALVAALTEVGIAAHVEGHPIGALNNNTETIHVLVGEKEYPQEYPI